MTTVFSTGEQILLLVMICASVGFFWLRLRPALDAIRGSRATPDFDLADLGPRIRDFLWEVMLQGKVIRQRPFAGLAHAFVFWGFCAFALITINHIATGFGAPLLSREQGFGRVYFDFVAIFALIVAISISYLAVRRFIARPVWLGEVSPESGVIALLIFLLMVTYLAGVYWPEATAAGHAAWWAHTLCLLAFLPLIPHTKHLHLVLSPATVFLKRERFSEIPKLEGD